MLLLFLHASKHLISIFCLLSSWNLGRWIDVSTLTCSDVKWRLRLKMRNSESGSGTCQTCITLKCVSWCFEPLNNKFSQEVTGAFSLCPNVREQYFYQQLPDSVVRAASFILILLKLTFIYCVVKSSEINACHVAVGKW